LSRWRIENLKVVMYTQSTCPWCRRAKKWFSERDIPFDFIDYDLADEERKGSIRKEMNERNVPLAFPYIKIGDEVVVGYDPDKFEELLKE
jgi:glutaredoxin